MAAVESVLATMCCLVSMATCSILLSYFTSILPSQRNLLTR